MLFCVIKRSKKDVLIVTVIKGICWDIKAQAMLFMSLSVSFSTAENTDFYKIISTGDICYHIAKQRSVVLPVVLVRKVTRKKEQMTFKALLIYLRTFFPEI